MAYCTADVQEVMKVILPEQLKKILSATKLEAM